MMLKGGGNNVLLSLPGSQPGGGDNGLVIGLTAAGGEVDFPGLTAQAGCHLVPGIVQCLPGSLANRVEAGWVAEIVLEIGQHGVDGRLAHGGGCCIVCINVHGFTSPVTL